MTAQRRQPERITKARPPSETLLESLFRSTAGATGETFFRSLVLELTRLFNVHAAFVARLTDPAHAKILAICENGKVREGPALAIAMTRNNGYDAIVMAINLGAGMNGIEATQEIRKIPAYQGIPIVEIVASALVPKNPL